MYKKIAKEYYCNSQLRRETRGAWSPRLTCFQGYKHISGPVCRHRVQGIKACVYICANTHKHTEIHR